MFRPSALGRYIPESSRLIKPLDLDAWIYSYERLNQKTGKVQILAIAYAGKANNPSFHIQFNNDERRLEYIRQWIESQRSRQERKIADLKARREFTHTLQVNDILHNSWGYDQTNNDFYKVVEVKGKSVVIVALAQMQVEAHSSMSGTCQPIPGEDTGKRETKRVLFGNCLKMDHGYASKWSGKPVYESSYA